MTNFKKNDEGVSAVIGVILMVAITVILAAVIAAFVFGMAGGVQQKKNVAFTIKRTVVDVSGTATPCLDITFVDKGGAQTVENLVFTAPAGIAYSSGSGDPTEAVMTVGDTYTYTLTGTETVHVVAYATVDGNEQVVIDTTI
jgi:flagellin-like protein